MRIEVLGGGPAGLYFGLLMKKADPSHHVTVHERNAPDATFGWGVVFSEETLGALRDADRLTFDQITESWARWTAIDVRYRGQTVRSRGHVFSGLARKRLLQILQERCRGLGVNLRFHEEVSDPFRLAASAELMVAADGVNSATRQARPDVFGTQEHVHRTKFAWFGTDLVFKAFTFLFRENGHGLFQVHAYPFDARTSTFIVECPIDVWRRAGLDRMNEEESIRYCEELFAEELAGHRLMSNRSVWISFVTLRNRSWHDGNVALMGDAAHTAHFTIGSGTKLAMEDAIALAECLDRWPGDLEQALTFYELERQPAVERFQLAALDSARYFENVGRYARLEPLQFAFNLLTRSGRITHLELEKRDPSFVAEVDARFAGRAGATVSPPPSLVPLRLGGVEVPNRVVRWPVGEDDSVEGMPSEGLASSLLAAARSGAGLLLTEMVAVSGQGRITSGTPGLWTEEQAGAWQEIVARIHSDTEARVGLLLGHAGRRGSCRPRRSGVDRPLRSGGWNLVSASAMPYTRRSPVPHPLAPEELPGLAEEFTRSAVMGAEAGFDLVEVHMGHGYLLASFLSPLTNEGADRLRFPLLVFESVRAAWPADRPAAAALNGTDWAPGGVDPGMAVELARALAGAGCDLVHVLAGQTIPLDRPDHGRQFLVPIADRIRGESGLPMLVAGGITTADEANTIVAAARADLCVLGS